MSITIVIPTYNGAAYLPDAVASVFAQTRPAAEVLVVDDCSTDDTRAVADKLARNAPVPVRVIPLPRNTGGPAGPIRAGYAAAAGEYVAVLDQDDVLHPDKLAREAAVLDARPDVPLAVSRHAQLGQADSPAWLAEPFGAVLGGPAEPVPGVERAVVVDGRRVLTALVRYGNFVVGFPGFTARRAALLAAGVPDPGLRIAADYDALCRLARAGPVGVVDAVGYSRRFHAGNLSGETPDTWLDTARVRCRYWAAGDPQPAAVAAEVRADLLGLGYKFRRAGRFRDGWACYRLAGRTWGWDRTTVAAAGKLFAAWVTRAR